MRTVCLAVASTLLAGMLLRAGLTPAFAHDADWVAPDNAVARINPLAGRSDVVAGGGRLFHERCGTCHGEDARGTMRAPALRKASVEAQSDGALFWKISSGNTRTGMPSFSFLPQLQRWQLVLYLRAQARTRSGTARGGIGRAVDQISVSGVRR
jgi:mono/diheme cytochrome c family protein